MSYDSNPEFRHVLQLLLESERGLCAERERNNEIHAEQNKLYMEVRVLEQRLKNEIADRNTPRPTIENVNALMEAVRNNEVISAIRALRVIVGHEGLKECKDAVDKWLGWF
jgi:ribosomal protein L7/L12